MNQNILEKELIATAASKLVEPGMVVAIDSGTKTWRVASSIKKKGQLTVIITAWSLQIQG